VRSLTHAHGGAPHTGNTTHPPGVPRLLAAALNPFAADRVLRTALTLECTFIVTRGDATPGFAALWLCCSPPSPAPAPPGASPRPKRPGRQRPRDRALHAGAIAGNVLRVNPSAPHPPAAPPRFNVLGTGVSALSLAQARDLVLGARGKKRMGYICQATAYGVSMAVDDPEFRAALNGSWLTHPDGMPLVWLGRWRGHADITRAYGPDLMAAVCDAGRAVGLRHFFYGGAPGVAESLREKLSTRFPGLDVAGTFTPPFRNLSSEEFAALRNAIAAAQPDIVWVGLSSPKQERFMAAHWRELDAGVLIGVGAAFDFLSGRVPQAPRWMQRSGLEWLFRLGTEPRRLWKRYLINNPLFVLRTAAQHCGLKKYPLKSQMKL